MEGRGGEGKVGKKGARDDSDKVEMKKARAVKEVEPAREGMEAGRRRGGGECVTGEVGEVVTPRGRASGSRPYGFPHRNEGECIKLGNRRRGSGILASSSQRFEPFASRAEGVPSQIVKLKIETAAFIRAIYSIHSEVQTCVQAVRVPPSSWAERRSCVTDIASLGSVLLSLRLRRDSSSITLPYTLS